MLFGFESRVGHGDHFNAHLGELVFEAIDLRVAPIVAAVMQHNRGGRLHAFDLGEFTRGELDG